MGDVRLCGAGVSGGVSADGGRNGREDGEVVRKFWSERYHSTTGVEVLMRTELTDSPSYYRVISATST